MIEGSEKPVLLIFPFIVEKAAVLLGKLAVIVLFFEFVGIFDLFLS